jgi:hypothetical protein
MSHMRGVNLEKRIILRFAAKTIDGSAILIQAFPYAPDHVGRGSSMACELAEPNAPRVRFGQRLYLYFGNHE